MYGDGRVVLQEGLYFAQALDDVVQGEALWHWSCVAIVPAAVDATAKGTRHIGLKAVSDEEYFIGGYATSAHGFLKEGFGRLLCSDIIRDKEVGEVV